LLPLPLSLSLSLSLPIWFSYAAGRKAPRGVGKGRGGKQEHITLEAPEKERETGGEGLLATEVCEMPTEPKATAVRAGARRVAARPAIVSLFPCASSFCFSLRNNTDNASPITHECSLSLVLSRSLSPSIARALSSLSLARCVLVSLDKVSSPGWKRRRWMFIRRSVLDFESLALVSCIVFVPFQNLWCCSKWRSSISIFSQIWRHPKY
jgi:hypothetical protein